MNPYEQMELKQAEFTKTDRRIYDCIMDNADAVFRDSSVVLAERFGVSQPALTRFCQRIGYRGYGDFAAAMFQAKKAEMTSSGASSSTIEAYCDIIRKIPAVFETAEVIELVDRIVHARNIYATGVHRSSLSAQLFSFNMQALGKPCCYASTEVLATAVRTFTTEDVVVVFSARSKALKETVETTREGNPSHQPYIALICMDTRHPLRKLSDLAIWLPNWQNQRMSQYLESQISAMIFCDLFSSTVAHELGNRGADIDTRWQTTPSPATSTDTETASTKEGKDTHDFN